jgi:K(+)-stimulated pyrophosphate-energized sodium pump
MLVELNILISLIALCVALILNSYVLKKPAGTKLMQYYAQIIYRGAITFLKKEYQAILVFVAIAWVVLHFLFGSELAISFVAGALFSAAAGFQAMIIATKTNVRTAEAAKKSTKEAIDTAFLASTAVGLATASIGLFGISIFYMLFQDTSIIYGFALGASIIALFARVGGGIYTKAADIAADIVGKIESKITEDDPRNPAAIADNVGDNVGDVAGMGADLFESYVGSIIATMAIASLVGAQQLIVFPLTIAAIGIISCGVSVLVLRKQLNYKTIILSCFMLAGLLILLLSLAALKLFVPEIVIMDGVSYSRFGILVAVAAGLFSGFMIGKITIRYTSVYDRKVKQLAKITETGTATNILQGLSLGMESVTPIVFTLVVSILISYYFASIYGIALSAVGLLSTLAVILAIDVFGPISDNAQGISEMAKCEKKVKDSTRILDSIGNTTAALGKGFAVASSAYTSLAFFFTYAVVSNLDAVDLIKPAVFIGLLTGGALAFLFSSISINAVGVAADKMIKEIRRQFVKLNLLTDKKAVPDYNRCIDISTKAALHEMMIPGFIAISAPVLLGLLLGVEAVAGLIAGCLLVGFVLAVTMFNSGAAWDNAKKVLENRKIRDKTLSYAIVGDTVGDPLKDTAGPSLNILIKLISIVSLIILPLLLKYGALINL